jgi:hypothetical protein
VTTLPPETLRAFLDHGDPAPRLVEGVDDARRVADRLEGLGIALGRVAAALESDGEQKFATSWDRFVADMDRKRAAYIRRYFQQDWGNCHLYDLLVNTRCGLDEAARCVICAAGLTPVNS